MARRQDPAIQHFLRMGIAMAAAVALAAVRRMRHRHAFLPPSVTDSWLLILFPWIAGHLTFYILFSPFMAVALAAGVARGAARGRACVASGPGRARTW